MSVSKPSRRKLWIILGVVVVAVIVVASVAFITRLPTFAPPAPSGPNVTIWNGTFCSDSGNCGYVPTVKNFTTGTTVTWSNTVGMTHPVSTLVSAQYRSVDCPVPDATGIESLSSLHAY